MRIVHSLGIAMLLLAGIAATARGDASDRRGDANGTALEARAPELSCVLSFPAAGGAIADGEREKIVMFANALQGEIRDHPVIVVAWADATMPPERGALPKTERNLAALRAKSVVDVLRDSGIGKIESYTMTEHASWLQDVFATKSAEVKGEARTAWLTNKERALVGDRARALGGSGRAVVMSWVMPPAVAH